MNNYMINFNDNLSKLEQELNRLQLKLNNTIVTKQSVLDLLKTTDGSPLFFPLTLSKSRINVVSIDSYLSSLVSIDLFPTNINSFELSKKVSSSGKDPITKQIIIKHNLELYKDDIKTNNTPICISIGVISVKGYKIKRLNYLYKDKDDTNPKIKYQADIIMKKEKVDNDYSKIYINDIREISNILKLVRKHIPTYKKAYKDIALPEKLNKVYEDRMSYIFNILNLFLLLVKRSIN